MRGYYRDFFWHSVSNMTRSVLAALAATAFLAFSPLLFADTDEPPLHVATHGADVGDCLDEASPCRSIDYALRRVGKNGRILIAAGDYALETPENVFYLVSGAIDVKAEIGTTLVGVPHEFANELGARGIRVIADSKSLDRDVAEILVSTRDSVESSMAATDCVGGFAGTFPCSNISPDSIPGPKPDSMVLRIIRLLP